ncbi:MAG: RNB domain-containing ribonuclease [Deltaproteobacteria bacterium]|jgi:exoribonuclease-2|nr:RNB domain-containing ribonuclease [Deltaproteobacteria bacterium]
MSQKPVVEYLEGGEFCLAWALDSPEGAGKNFEALTQTGKTIRLSPSRILTMESFEDPNEKLGRLAALNELAQKRETLAQNTILEEIWQVLEGEGPEFEYDLLASLAYGIEPGPLELSAIRRAIQADQNDQAYFAFGPQKATRHSPEEMAKKRLILERKKNHQEFVSQTGEWLKLSLAKKMAYEPEASDKALALLSDLAVKEDQAQDPRTAKELLRAAGLPDTPLGALEALVAVGHFHVHENLELRRLNLGRPFTEPELAEAQRIIANYQSPADRLDLTATNVITIDAEGAKEFDDGVSLSPGPDGLIRLGVHIADVASVIRPKTLLDEAARSRAASIYLPDAKYSMIPEEVTESLLSLKLGQIRPAFSLLVDLDPYGEPKNFVFKPSLIKVARQMSFDEADDLLGNDQELLKLREVGQTLLNRRLEFGGQSLNLPQLRVSLNPEGQIDLELTNWDTPARLMIGEMMVLANHLAAEALSRASLACPYRYQEKARSRPFENREPRSKREELAFGLAARRQVGRSGVGLTPSPHWGLGLTSYAQFTSPIRRYADLLVARQLRSLSDPTLPPYTRAEMTEMAFEADETHRAIKRAQNDRIRYFLTLALANQIGSEFTGLIFERQENRARVCVTDFMLEMDMYKLPHEAKLGRDVRVKLTQADPRAQILKFEYVSLA